MIQFMLNLMTNLLKFAFILAAACSLGVALLLYGVYRVCGGRSLQAETQLRNLRVRIKNPDKDWLKLKVLGAGNSRCPHCRAALDAKQDHDLCPECYGDLKRTCLGCGEPVNVRRRICPFCNHDLRT